MDSRSRFLTHRDDTYWPWTCPPPEPDILYCPNGSPRNGSSGPISFWLNMSDYSCSYFDSCCCPLLSADADIAGIGVRGSFVCNIQRPLQNLTVLEQVILAFFITAALANVCTTLHMLLQRKSTYQGAPSINPIDRFLRRRLAEPIQNWFGPRQSKRYAEALYNLVLSLSDTQLVTGIAILVPSLYKLNEGTITVYHFSIVMDLAWIASNTYILTLLVVSRQYREKDSIGSTQSPARKIHFSIILRILFMIILAAMLLYNSWVSAYIYWAANFSCPATCAIRPSIREHGGEPLSWSITNFVLVLVAYTNAFIQFSATIRRTWLTRVRSKIVVSGNSQTAAPVSNGTIWTCFKIAAWTVILNIRIYVLKPIWYLLASEFEGVIEQAVWFVLGIYWTLSDRYWGHYEMDTDEIVAEDSWGFGQFVPVVLLLIPLLQFIVTLEDEAS